MPNLGRPSVKSIEPFFVTTKFRNPSLENVVSVRDVAVLLVGIRKSVKISAFMALQRTDEGWSGAL
jgi:hypothetical protein